MGRLSNYLFLLQDKLKLTVSWVWDVISLVDSRQTPKAAVRTRRWRGVCARRRAAEHVPSPEDIMSYGMCVCVCVCVCSCVCVCVTVEDADELFMVFINILTWLVNPCWSDMFLSFITLFSVVVFVAWGKTALCSLLWAIFNTSWSHMVPSWRHVVLGSPRASFLPNFITPTQSCIRLVSPQEDSVSAGVCLCTSLCLSTANRAHCWTH